NRMTVKGKYSGAQEQEGKVKTISFKSSDEVLMERIVGIINKYLEDPSLNVQLLARSEEHTSELQSRENLVCRLLLEKKKQQPDQRQRDAPRRRPGSRRPARTCCARPSWQRRQNGDCGRGWVGSSRPVHLLRLRRRLM